MPMEDNPAERELDPRERRLIDRPRRSRRSMGWSIASPSLLTALAIWGAITTDLGPWFRLLWVVFGVASVVLLVFAVVRYVRFPPSLGDRALENKEESKETRRGS